MNEEIRKNEIREDELENVAGGSNYDGICPRCGGRGVNSVIEGRNAFVCESCSYTHPLTLRSISKGQ